jgi:Fe-S cluster assembly protein SufD
VADVRIGEAARRAGVTVGDAATADQPDASIDAVADSGTDAFTELNAAFADAVVVARVPEGASVEAPIAIVHWVDADGAAAFPRTVVQLGADSEATVVEWAASSDVAAYYDPVVELDVGQAARLGYVGVQSLGPRVWQTAYNAAAVERDATLRWSVIALGGDYARVRADARLVGRGASSDLQAVYFGSAGQMHDFRTMQDHAAPSTTSDLLFKGAVEDVAQSVYSGLIRVRKEAVGTNAFQTNRNLVLSEGARAESVPNLEIETNDVRCSHASAVGPIDDDQRFYLESRGIPPEETERLIVLGFFADILGGLPARTLGERMRAEVATKLAARAR